MRFKNIFAISVIMLTIILLVYFIGDSLLHQPAYDIVIQNGLIVDGMGGEPYRADIGISQGKITKIGSLVKKGTLQFINADGLMVCPGFIDVLTCVDRGILTHPEAYNFIRQGVTTIVGGNLGNSPYPIGDFLAKVAKTKMTLNFCTLAGYNTIRNKVLGNKHRVPGKNDIHLLTQWVARAMKEGAVGLSMDLKYLPDTYKNMHELIEVAKVVRWYNGFCATCLRNEGLDIQESLHEIIEMGKTANLPIHISHYQIASIDKWGDSHETLDIIKKARNAKHRVSLDEQPYPAICNNLTSLFPAWALDGDKKEWPVRWSDGKLKSRLVKDIIFNILHDYGGGNLNRIMLASYPAEPELEGLTIGQILVRKGLPVTLGNGAEMIIELQLKGMAGINRAIFFCLSDGDIEAILKYPPTIITSNGCVETINGGRPHPGCYGTFPRVLKKYVREKGILTFAEAVKKMTWLPARRLGLRKRGCIAEGFYADITIVDPVSVSDMATWENPQQYPRGIPYVLVNGEPVVRDNKFQGVYPGRVIYKH